MFHVHSWVGSMIQIKEKSVLVLASHMMASRGFEGHRTVLVPSPVLAILSPDQSNLRKKRFVVTHGVKSSWREVRQQEPETVGHIAPMVRGQRMANGAAHRHSDPPSQIPAREQSHPQWACPALFCSCSEAHSPQRILGPVRLAIFPLILTDPVYPCFRVVSYLNAYLISRFRVK